jgi:hypothetical protein
MLSTTVYKPSILKDDDYDIVVDIDDVQRNSLLLSSILLILLIQSTSPHDNEDKYNIAKYFKSLDKDSVNILCYDYEVLNNAIKRENILLEVCSISMLSLGSSRKF